VVVRIVRVSAVRLRVVCRDRRSCLEGGPAVLSWAGAASTRNSGHTGTIAITRYHFMILSSDEWYIHQTIHDECAINQVGTARSYVAKRMIAVKADAHHGPGGPVRSDGAVRCGPTWSGAVQRGPVRFNVVRCGPM
jgi:hypothetical protein